MHEAVIRLELEPLEEGGFVATSPDVPGLVAQGRTIAEIRHIAEDLTRKLGETCIDYGQDLPPSMASVLADDTVIGLRVQVVSREPFE